MNTTIARVVGSSSHSPGEREENDYYATDPQALRNFLDASKDDLELTNNVWEPACGEGNLSRVLIEREHYVLSTDLVDRGYGVCMDFLTGDHWAWNGDILTNPPYKLAQKFIEKSLEMIKRRRYAIFLLRIQFLEGQKRKKFFEEYPPKFVYVHSARIGIWKNNDQEKYSGNALCFAWFVWEKGYNGDTITRWI